MKLALQWHRYTDQDRCLMQMTIIWLKAADWLVTRSPLLTGRLGGNGGGLVGGRSFSSEFIGSRSSIDSYVNCYFRRKVLKFKASDWGKSNDLWIRYNRKAEVSRVKKMFTYSPTYTKEMWHPGKEAREATELHDLPNCHLSKNILQISIWIAV
jgi:hypothetical protein